MFGHFNIYFYLCVMRGKIIKTTGKHYTVKTSEGEIIKSFLKGNFRVKGIKSTNPIVVGDIVNVTRDTGEWMINHLYERRNSIRRKSVNLSKQTHIIAANIDQAILIITLDSPVTSTGFIDRFLVAGKAYDIEVILFFNKLDILSQELKSQFKDLQNIYKDIGYKCFSGSIINDDLKSIKNIMKNKVNIISGHSGVGKSTLINKLQPQLEINVAEISETHNQGQHTTTFSQLYELDFGGSVIDTPGIRGFGLVELEVREIGNCFPEFIAVKDSCRFHNCLHKDEPDCAVKFAVEDNSISIVRYKNYLNMLVEEDTSFRTNKY